MAIFFKTSLNENNAFDRMDKALSGSSDFDGYLNIVDEQGETTISRGSSMHAEEFKAHVTDRMQKVWDAARFWVIYERRDDRNDLSANEIRNAAIKITRGYPGTIVVTMSLLGRYDETNDLELVFVCFQEDLHRRNFKVRYEGKFLGDI